MRVFRKNIAVFIFALLAFGCAHPSRAGESIWSALVLATNEKEPAKPAPEIEKYEGQLKNIFGYNQFTLIGHHVEQMNNPAEHWLIPGQDFYLRAESSKGEKPGAYNLKFDLYQDKKLLAKMETKVLGQNLLFIRGPMYGEGQLVIILVVK